MRSVADDLRDELRQRVAAMTPEERMRLSFELGEADLTLLQAARGISRDEAKAIFKRTRQHGRRRSVSACR